MARVVGLTGGIGTGKSTVARMLAARGAVVVDADAIVRELQQPGSPVLEEIVAAFGHGTIGVGGELDREALAAIVFRDPEARARLNAIVHPRVVATMLRRAREAEAAGAPLVALDVPLLLDDPAAPSPATSFGLDAIVVVYAPEPKQVERQVQRESYGLDEARRRIRAQRSIEEKRALADFVIDNSGDLAETEHQVDALFRRLTGESPAGTAS